MYSQEKRREVIELRRKGRLSLAAIVKKAGISKGIASLWLRSFPLTSAELHQRMSDNGKRSRGRKWPSVATSVVETVFQRSAHSSRFRDAALGYAIAWFMGRGYSASIPVGQEPYDLVVDSDLGLQKVQVKSTNRLNQWGQYYVQVCKRVYDRKRKINASGKRRRMPYLSNEVDWFFILTGKQDIYLIPRGTLKSKKSLTLDRAYASFKK